MKKILAFLLLSLLFITPSFAQQNKIPPLELYKAMAEVNKQNGWVQFREYDSESEIMMFEPSIGVGEATCAFIVQ